MKKILLIMDDPASEENFLTLFEGPDYRVSCVHEISPILTGQYFVPDLFVIEQKLSAAEGIKVCRLLKERPGSKYTPIIFMSDSADLIASALEQGADGVLIKPYTLKTLKHTVGKYL